VTKLSMTLNFKIGSTRDRAKRKSNTDYQGETLSSR